jgi:glycosyltransferase involved in cell wall biosynthesis
MNIALFSHNGNLEGASLMLSGLATDLQAANHNCSLILATSGLLEKKITVQYNVVDAVYESPGYYLAHNKPDLAIVNTILGFRIVEECKKYGIPVLWIIHESDTTFLQKGITKKHFEMANAVIFPSKFTKEQYADFDTGNFRTVFNGIDTESITSFKDTHSKEALRAQYNIPHDASVFLSVGTHHALKGFETVVDASTHLIQKHPEHNIHCIIAGRIPGAKEQAEADALLRKSWDSDTRSSLHMYAEFPNIYDLFCLSDFYICASNLETFPLTILEAMAFQLPIIATNVGGIPEQISDTSEGLLIQPKNVHALSEAMDACISNPEMANYMGSLAHAKCMKQFTRSKMSERYLNIIADMSLSKKKKARHEQSDTGIQKDVEISLIFRASRAEHIEESLQAAIALFPYYKEFIIGASPDLPSETIQFLESVPRTRIVPGTNERENAGDLHYRLLDECTGEWIVNIDDDDLWLYAPNLGEMESDIGLVHGEYLYLNSYLTHDKERRNVIKQGSSVVHPREVNNVTGSGWIMRREAWQSISKLMIDRSFNHSDWRMFHSLIQNGWRAYHCPRLMAVMQRFSYNFPEGPGHEWHDVFKKIEARAGKEQWYQEQDWHIVDYKCFPVEGTSSLCRGPEIDFAKPYFTCVGAAQTYGCLVEKPYPTLLSEQLQLPVLNLGIGSAGPSYFLKHPTLLSHINNGSLAVVQIMSGRSMHNAFFETKNGGLPLIRIHDGKEMTATQAYTWLREQYDERFIQKIVEETQQNWIQSYKELLQSITVPTILLWFSTRTPDFTPSFETVQSIMGNFPHMVTRNMVEAIIPHADSYTECTTNKDMPFHLFDRLTGKPAKITRRTPIFEEKVRTQESYYPSPSMHIDAASALIKDCKTMKMHTQTHLHTT